MIWTDRRNNEEICFIRSLLMHLQDGLCHDRQNINVIAAVSG